MTADFVAIRIAVILAAALVGSASNSLGQQISGTSLVVRLRDYAGLSPGTIGEAERETAKVFAHIGVRTIWLDDAAAPPPHVPGLELRVIVLGLTMANRKIAADGVAQGVLGQAARETGVAYIFQSRIRDVAARYTVCFELLMGKVIAHELGHLLLASGHSETGIMREAVMARSRVPEFFTAPQGAEIRLALAR